jgi:hypothetical protein
MTKCKPLSAPHRRLFSMTRSPIFQCAVLALIIAVCAFGQLALAQSAPHPTLRRLPGTGQAAEAHANDLAANLYGVTQLFGATAVPFGLNSDGSTIWPCEGTYNSSTAANPDCPTIGNPSQPFPFGGEVIAAPFYVWSLSECNATSTSTPPCGQIEYFYEDTTGDITDDVLVHWTAQQGSSYIYDSGLWDFGPDVFGQTGSDYPLLVLVENDQNFGTMGQTSKNNGNCLGDYNYPFVGRPTYPYFIAANKTCVAAVAGPVTLTGTAELATPHYHVNPKTGETTVTYTVKYEEEQKWTIYLQ